MPFNQTCILSCQPATWIDPNQIEITRSAQGHQSSFERSVPSSRICDIENGQCKLAHHHRKTTTARQDWIWTISKILQSKDEKPKELR